jgi:murein DD-endopeptidase MepM/ murein hydrolase activator NlpD
VVFQPGELVPYVTRSGDTLPAIAAHFNTSVDEITQANPSLTQTSTTLPQGLQIQVPIYYLPLTGTPFQILPDSEVVYGPSGIDFDLREEVMSHPGYLAGLSDYAFRIERVAWEVIHVVAQNYSIHPRLLLTLLEYQTLALTHPFAEEDQEQYPLAYINSRYQGLFRQLLWAAERLNDGYYGWRSGSLREFETLDGRLYQPDYWQNAGTVALQYLFAGQYAFDEFERVISSDGFIQTYYELWGDPFSYAIEIIPGNLQQPEIVLPFLPNRIWDFTGGPHFSWGTSLPLGALDFAPPAMEGGCTLSNEWVAAPIEGIIARSGEAIVVLDVDGDGDERTGWVFFFFHIASNDRIQAGSQVEIGDLIGHPSCEGGRSTGTHFHIARRYNGEWISAGGLVPFTMDGWVAAEGDEIYQGTLTKGSKEVTACTCSTEENRILYELPQAP